MLRACVDTGIKSDQSGNDYLFRIIYASRAYIDRSRLIKYESVAIRKNVLRI